MSNIWPYLGDLHQALPSRPEVACSILMLCSILCGMIIGLEREMKDKPAGLRTLSLICVGSTIFTLASILLGRYGAADKGRVAAQIVTGIGFLGAGAIIRNRGTVVGMTTAATVWAVAAIGLMIGAGYAAAGVALTFVVLGMLTLVSWLEHKFVDPCSYTTARFRYLPNHGKTRLRVLQILDHHHLPQRAWSTHAEADAEVLELRFCHLHWEHRQVIYPLARIPGMIESDAQLPEHHEQTPAHS